MNLVDPAMLPNQPVQINPGDMNTPIPTPIGNVVYTYDEVGTPPGDGHYQVIHNKR